MGAARFIFATLLQRRGAARIALRARAGLPRLGVSVGSRDRRPHGATVQLLNKHLSVQPVMQAPQALRAERRWFAMSRNTWPGYSQRGAVSGNYAHSRRSERSAAHAIARLPGAIKPNTPLHTKGNEQVKLLRYTRNGMTLFEMMCHCCHWVEVEAQVEVEMEAAQLQAVATASPNDPPSEPPTSSVPDAVHMGEDIRALLRHMKELTEEGLLTEYEASTLRLELMRSRLV